MPKITVNIFFPRVRIWPRAKPCVYSVYMVATGASSDAYEVVAIYEDRHIARQNVRECNEASARAGDLTNYAWVEEIAFHPADD